jgi:predicted nucleic acid-binding protein
MEVFIDTWGWVTLFNKSEKRHREVEKWYRDFRFKGGTIYTTDYVLDETFTLLFIRTPVEIAINSMKKIDKSINEEYLILTIITPERFEEAKKLRLKYKDKPLISFTDLTSAVVMSQEGIKAILTQDRHFTYLESRFQIVP